MPLPHKNLSLWHSRRTILSSNFLRIFATTFGNESLYYFAFLTCQNRYFLRIYFLFFSTKTQKITFMWHVHVKLTLWQQALEAIRQLKESIPISRAQMKLAISLPEKEGKKLAPQLQKLVAKVEAEEYDGDQYIMVSHDVISHHREFSLKFPLFGHISKKQKIWYLNVLWTRFAKDSYIDGRIFWEISGLFYRPWTIQKDQWIC